MDKPLEQVTTILTPIATTATTTTTTTTSATANLAKVTRVYTREELFRLASLMEDCDESMAALLNEHKNFDYDILDKMAAMAGNGFDYDNDYESLPRSFASYGRKKSDLMSQQNMDLLNQQTSRLSTQRHTKLYRMSSSPTIKYNNLNHKGEPVSFQNLSSQVQAKYARLIENMNKSSGKFLPQGMAQDRDEAWFDDELISRGSSCNRGATIRPTGDNYQQQQHQQISPRRLDSGQFGSLMRRRSEDSRKTDSDEPMSLPYSINTSSTREPGGTCEDSLGSKNRYIFTNEGDEEDDFDISSLLSITVLSDIRFIRQEMNQIQPTAAAARSQRTNTVQRTKSHELAANKLPPRSRTSLGFHLSDTRRDYLNNHSRYHQTNHQQIIHQQQQQQQAAASMTSPHGLRHHATQQRLVISSQTSTADQYNSLDETASLPFNWQVSPGRNSSGGLFVDKETALEYHLKCARNNSRDSSTTATTATTAAATAKSSRDVKKTTDKEEDPNRAKIIEIFKAQVIARASDSSPESKSVTDGASKRGPATSGGSTTSGLSGSKTIIASCTNVAQILDANKTSGAKIDAKSDKENTETAPQTNNEAKSKLALIESEPKTTSQVGADLAKGEKQQAIDVICSERVEQPTKHDKIGVAEPQIVGQNVVRPRTSNIPRLVSLHRRQFGGGDGFGLGPAQTRDETSCQLLPVVVEAAKKATGTEPASQAGPNSRSNIKPGTKFVSQYKRLRGKSLADEVEELA